MDDVECRNCTDTSNLRTGAVDTATEVLQDLWNMSKNHSLDRLEPLQCITDYATMIQSQRRNVLLVTSNDNVNTSLNSTGSPLGHPLFFFTNNTNVYYASQFDAGSDGLNPEQAANSYDWICSALYRKDGPPCASQIDAIKSAPQTWRMTDGCSGPNMACSDWMWPVDYCLSEPAVPRCRLHFSPTVSIIVTILNFCEYRTDIILCSTLHASF